jgi:hypothetical protein
MKWSFVVLLLGVSILAVLPAAAQGAGILYDNGPVCPGYCHDAWQINGGYAVSDTFLAVTGSTVTGFDFWLWEFPGDRVFRVEWSITSSEFGGTTYGSGTSLVASDKFQGVNEYGYDIDKVTVTGLHVSLPPGTYWINLQNAVDEQHYPVYWDENSGEYCHSPGCPSMASESQLGTIPSETFDIRGTHVQDEDQQGQSPTPTSHLMLGPGILALGATLRRLLL